MSKETKQLKTKELRTKGHISENPWIKGVALFLIGFIVVFFVYGVIHSGQLPANVEKLLFVLATPIGGAITYIAAHFFPARLDKK